MILPEKKEMEDKLKEINKQSNGEESTPPSDEQDSSKTQTQEETRSSQLHRVEAEATPQPEVQLRRSNRVPKPNPKYANAALAEKVSEPTTFEEASQHNLWVEAMKEEIQALEENQTWELQA